MICTVLTEKHVRVTACTARMPVTHVFQCTSKLIPSIITAHLLKQRYLLVLPYKVAFLSYFRLSLEKITRQMQRFQLNCTDPQMLDQKSNDWRSIFLWLNIVLNLKRK